MGGKGSVLALTYQTGEVCRNREEVMDGILAKHPEITLTKNEVRIPGYFEDGAQYANAWLASHPAGRREPGDLGLLGRSRDRRDRRAAPQGRDDVKVYGINGNAQALENIKNGHMTATAWQDSFTEGSTWSRCSPTSRRPARMEADGGGGSGGAGDEGDRRRLPGPASRGAAVSASGERRPDA